jgi:hypothetical protein
MVFRRHRRWLALLAALTATSAAAQQAQAPVCVSLAAQLTALDQNRGPQNQALTTQYQIQSAALQVLQGQAAQQGCAVLFRAIAPPQCSAILARLDQLRASVAEIERALRAANANGNTGQRNAIIRALQQNNCFAQPEPPRQATYRTVCVRTCDGYYFPMNYATTRDHFEDDRAACEAQCPGQQVDLYFYRNPGEEVDAAVNLDGTAYTEMVNAFAFREAYNPSCRCGGPTVQVAAAGTGGPFTPLPAAATDRLAEATAIIPPPARRPVPTEDPETLANRAGGLTLPYDPFGGAAAALVIDGIRIVGPAFYAARE